jgi:hypothetical protein
VVAAEHLLGYVVPATASVRFMSGNAASDEREGRGSQQRASVANGGAGVSKTR